MQQTPISMPIIMESRRRLDLIMPIRLFMPGMIPREDAQHTIRMGSTDCRPITWTIRWLIPVSETRWFANSDRVSYACLSASALQVNGLLERRNSITYCRISSVIWCELSIRPRSASNESAAEDL